MTATPAAPSSAPSSVPSSAPAGRLFPSIWKLLRLRLLIAWNGFRHAKTRRKIGTIVVIVLLLAFVGFVFFLSWLLLGFLNSPNLAKYTGFDAKPFLQAMPVMIFAALFLFILFSSFGVLLQALYLSGDMDFLLTSPVPIRAVFVTKMLQAVLPNFGLIALFGLPVLFGLGISGHYNLLYYPLVLLTMLALTLAAAGLSALLVMLVVRIFPARRVAEVLGFFTATISILCGQSGNLYNAASHNMDISGAQVNGLFSLLVQLNTPWNPLNWAGRGLVELGEGRWLAGLALVTLTLGFSTAAFLLALGTAERWYYTGWAGMQVIAHRKKSVRVTREQTETPLAARVRRLLPAPVRAIIWKDFLVLRRDMRNMSQLISPLIFGVLYTFMFLGRGGIPPAGRGDMPAVIMDALRMLMTYGNIGMALFVGWMLLTRLAGIAFSSEGSNYWILKASPVRASHILAAKFLVAYLPTLVLGVFFMAAISLLQKASLGVFLYGMWTTAMCLAGMNGILLATGAAGANLTWTDPRKMNAGSIGCLGQFLTSLFLPVSFGLFIGPLVLVAFFDWPQAYGYLAGGLVGSAAAGVCALLPPWLVRKKVEQLDEK